MLSSRPPYPILQVWDSKKNVSQGMEVGKWVFRGRTTQQMGFIFAQKWPKNANFWGGEHVFWVLGGQFKAPQPYFAGA